jgi:hypothetical protein
VQKKEKIWIGVRKIDLCQKPDDTEIIEPVTKRNLLNSALKI